METFVQAMRNMGPTRLTVMGAIGLGLIGFFIFATSRLATPQMSLLYGDLENKDSGRIVAELETANVPYELRAGGREIYVPDDRVLRLRMGMADKGLPRGGSIGYELFDKTDALGTTDFQQRINLVRAMEGELARTVGTIDGVKTVRVHLVLPKRELFSREKQEPSASIFLRMDGSRRLDNEQIAAVQHLVATAVPQLSPKHISIVDGRGALLARGFDDEAEMGLMATKVEQRKRAFENRLARTIEELLEKNVGYGRVRAEVTADINYNRVTTNIEDYDPERQVVRSTQTIEEQNATKETDQNTDVSVSNNLPDGGGASGTGTSANSSEKRTEETVNYEIAKTVRSEIKEGGSVGKLSVAVLVDYAAETDAAGKPVYKDGMKILKERDRKDLDLLTTLVKSAIGYNAQRGDVVDVITMPFADAAAAEEPELQLFFGLNKNDLLRMAEILVLSIVAILVILLVVRPLVSRAFEALPAAAAVGEGLLAGEPGAPALPGARPVPAPGEEEELPYEEQIDIDRVEGRVKASSVKKVGEIVEKHPDEALAIIRSWMYQQD